MKTQLMTPYKDINGMDIWQGDILKVTTKFVRPAGTIRIEIVEVEFGEYPDGEGYGDYVHCGWHTKAGTLPDIYTISEVIGNIKDTPELLKIKPVIKCAD